MRAIDRLPEHESKDGYLHRVCIPCIFNSGRRATVRATIGHPEIIHISIDTDNMRPYQYIADGYLHIDTDFIDEDLKRNPDEFLYFRRKEAEENVAMIREINKYYFAGNLTVLSDDNEITERYIPRQRNFSEFFSNVKKEISSFLHKEDEWYFETFGIKNTLADRIKKSVRNIVNIFKKQKERIEVVQPISKGHFGGTWQHYYTDKNWLRETEAIKGGRVYLA